MSSYQEEMCSYQKFVQVGLAVDPVHVGAGGARIGRVDLPIVRDPVTQVPKIPGSSLAGVYRSYVAMNLEEERLQKKPSNRDPYFPHCAGLGQPKTPGSGGHCGQPDCPVCTVFGFAKGKGQGGGFAGLAAFSDAQVLLFPVPTRRGPYWLTCPMALQTLDPGVQGIDEAVVYVKNATGDSGKTGVENRRLNLGWLFLPEKQFDQYNKIREKLTTNLKIPKTIADSLAVVSDGLFTHIVNSNLEVRTSVSINPATGAAEEGALFSYEALPRTTVLIWEIIAKNPKHFQINGKDICAVKDPSSVYEICKKAHAYLEHLGIGGMGTRGMGRLKVLCPEEASPASAGPEDSAKDQSPTCETAQANGS